MNKKFSLVLIIIGGILLYLFFGRKTLPASTAPVSQPGVAAGGINFSSVDTVTGLPVFDSSAPAQYIRGLAPQSGGMYNCGNGTTPAVNASDGQVYCVIPAEAGVFSSSSPVVAPSTYTGAPQGPTEGGGYLGGPPTYTAAPQGPTLVNGNPGIVGQATSGSDTDPNLVSGGDPTGLQDESTLFAV